MILVATIGLVGAATVKTGTLFQRVAAEKELLEIGAQFSEALRSYAAATPPGQPQQPPSFKELLRDPRFPNPRRHLRRVFVDPMTGKAEWGVVYLREKTGILAVYSLSNARPFKVANFDLRFQNLEGRERISDWKFAMAGANGANPALVPPPNGMTGAGSAPPSLFAPTPPSDPNGGKAVPPPAPVAAPEGPMTPPDPDAPPPANDEQKPEEEDTPAEPPPEEERDTESEEGKATIPATGTKGPSAIVTPPPAHRRSR